MGVLGGNDVMVSKITLGLVLAAVGLGMALLPTMLYLATLGSPIGDMLGADVVPSIPVYLVLSMIGIPPSILGAITFRKGVRELVESQILSTRVGATTTSGIASGRQPPLVAGPHSTRPQIEQQDHRAPSPPPQTAHHRTVSRPEGASPFRVRTRSDSKVCPSCGATMGIDVPSCPSCSFRFTVDLESGCPVCGAPLSRLTRISPTLFVCGVCFSELERVAAAGTG